MLKGDVLHPEILKVLGSAGHGARILIADGNFPFSTGAAPHVPRVYLNLAPDKLSVTDVLEEIVKVVPIESVIAPVPLLRGGSLSRHRSGHRYGRDAYLLVHHPCYRGSVGPAKT